MKELTTEQKAKRYDEAVEKAKNTIEVNQTIPEIIECVESLFPELVESEDEKIRKHLISLFENFVILGVANECETADIKVDNILAWLEKKKTFCSIDEICSKANIPLPYKDGNAWCILLGDNIQEGVCGFGNTKEEAFTEFLKEAIQNKQKSVKVDSVFKIGEVITDGTSTFKIVDIKEEHYITDDGDKVSFYVAHRYYTYIQNFEPYKSSDEVKPNNVYDKELSEILGRVIRKYINDPNILYTEREKVSTEIIPYVERLEKQSEQKPTIIIPKFRVGDKICWKGDIDNSDTIAEICDGYYLNSLGNRMDISYTDTNFELVKQEMKELLQTEYEKGRADAVAEMQKFSWSEEDEQNFNEALSYIKDDSLKEFIKSLGFLRFHKQWKPSEEQMAALLVAVGDEKKLGSNAYKELYKLYLQLKQL